LDIEGGAGGGLGGEFSIGDSEENATINDESMNRSINKIREDALKVQGGGGLGGHIHIDINSLKETDTVGYGGGFEATKTTNGVVISKFEMGGGNKE